MIEAQKINEIIDLNSQMRCGIVTNLKGDILIVHDLEIKSEIQWVEFDEVEQKLFLIHEDGMPQDLGIQLDSKMRCNIAQGTSVMITQVVDSQIIAFQETTIIIKNY